jgi:ParB-like chromosome segregation protein Spo0J
LQEYRHTRKEIELEIVKLKIKDLKPYADNAKIHTKQQTEALINSIRKFGFNAPVGVFGKDNQIIYGHERVEALKEMGATEAECVRLDHMTPEQAKAFRLVENQLGLETGWDAMLLNFEMDDIINFNMSDFGLSKKLPRAESNSKITCPECGLEFSAEGGGDKGG